VSTADRLSPGYEPNFDIDLKRGQQGELYTADIIDALAEAKGQVEVKTDERALQTQRVYVEYECRKFGGWEKSGIAISTAEFWAFVLGGDTVVISPTWRVRNASRRLWRDQPGLRVECRRGSHPTKGIAIPLKYLLLELFGT
jgi:hypothetical protein